MPFRPPARWLPSAVLVAAVLAAACAPTAPTQPTGSRPPGSGGKASPRPSDGPGASEAPPAASLPPGATVAPGSAPPSAFVPASPAPSGLAASASPVAPARSALVDQVANKLLNLAKVGFNQNRSQLASAGDTAKAGLIGNNSAGVISNNAGSLLSDKGLGLVANNGGSLVSDNGGGVVANNGGGYRVLQATALPTLPPRVEIATTAGPGETLAQRRVFPDGTVTLRFTRATATDPEAYRSVHVRDGAAFHEYAEETLERWPNGKDKRNRTVTKDLFGGGALAAQVGVLGDHSETGKSIGMAIEPPTFLRDQATGAGSLVEALTMDFETGAGSFRYAYPALGMVEAGTLTNAGRDGTGLLKLSTWDPLAIFDGTATAKVGDVTVYTRTVATAGAARTTTYDLADGIGLALTRAADALRFEGHLTKDGVKIAQARLELAPDGTAIFTVTFDDDPTKPLVVGYGTEGIPQTPAATPKPEPVVTSLLGRGGSGFADGPAPLAKFQVFADIAASRKTAGVYYIVDQGAHRVRVLDSNAQVVSTLAGDGTAGSQDGPGATARFSAPISLAVAADDTLYVSERDFALIRMIAPDGTVSTLAGSGTRTYADGTGAAASFSGPSGIALDDASGALYIADYHNRRIRRVGTRGPDLGVVTTLAGTGDAAFADGPGAAASFNGPIAVAVGPDGDLYVSDSLNHRIRKIDLDDPAHPVTTVVGSDAPAHLGMDGAALSTGLRNPRSLAFDAAGRLLFASLIDIRRLEPDGQVRSLAGTGTALNVDGLARSASFSAINQILPLEDGSMFVATGSKLSVLLQP